MSKKDQESTAKIYNYLKQQNRPYSVNDILSNLHKEVGKATVQKSLDSLVEDESIKEKTYGKQKVYVVNQNAFPQLEDGKLKAIEARINEILQELKLKSKELTDLENKWKILGGSLTTEAAEEAICKIENEIVLMEESLSKNESKNVVVSQQEKERIEYDRESKLKEWKKRKQMALNMLDSILEGYPKSKKELYADIGIETDQDAGVDVSILT